jgi:hypothetical protein
LYLVGTGANVVKINNGRVALAREEGELMTIATLTVGKKSTDTDTLVYIGDGVTLTTANIHGGIPMFEKGCTTLNVDGGKPEIIGESAFTTINSDGGCIKYKSSGNCGTLNLAGEIDFSEDSRTREFTTINMYKGSVFNDPEGTVTGAAAADPAFNLVRCRREEVTINRPANRKWTESSI